MQQAFKETFGGSVIALLLHQNVQNHAVLIYRPPQIVEHTVDTDENLIQMPDVAGSWPPAAQATGKVTAEFAAPMTDRLKGYQDTTLGADKFDVAQAKACCQLEAAFQSCR